MLFNKGVVIINARRAVRIRGGAQICLALPWLHIMRKISLITIKENLKVTGFIHVCVKVNKSHVHIIDFLSDVLSSGAFQIPNNLV